MILSNYDNKVRYRICADVGCAEEGQEDVGVTHYVAYSLITGAVIT